MKSPDELKARDLIRFLDSWRTIQGDTGSLMIADLLDSIASYRWLTINLASDRLTPKAVGLWLRDLATTPIRRDPHTVFHIQFRGRGSAGMRWSLIVEDDEGTDGDEATPPRDDANTISQA